MLLILLMALDDPAALVSRAHTLTSAEHRCVQNADSSDVTVCGLRRADRFRVPFAVHDPGDPRHEGAWEERARLISPKTPVQDMGPFQVGGGMAGVSATVGTDGSSRAGGMRKPAP